jgi:hypothetical protein
MTADETEKARLKANATRQAGKEISQQKYTKSTGRVKSRFCGQVHCLSQKKGGNELVSQYMQL